MPAAERRGLPPSWPGRRSPWHPSKSGRAGKGKTDLCKGAGCTRRPSRPLLPAHPSPPRSPGGHWWSRRTPTTLAHGRHRRLSWEGGALVQYRARGSLSCKPDACNHVGCNHTRHGVWISNQLNACPRVVPEHLHHLLHHNASSVSHVLQVSRSVIWQARGQRWCWRLRATISSRHRSR